MSPGTVVFDLGKVLLDFDYAIAVKQIAKKSTKAAEDIGHFLRTSPLLLEYEAGKVSTGDFYTAMCAASGFCGNIDEFGLCFGDIFSPIQPMIQLQAELANRGVPTYVFSNTNDLAIGHIRRAFPFFHNFTGYVFSYEHRSMKPEPGMYEVLERLSGKQGSQIVYLDDRPENVQAGIARGWLGLVHETPGRSRWRLTELGLFA
jgi:glucose-1-phosphatase